MINKLWEKSKLLFILAFPIVLLILFKDVLISLLISSGKKRASRTREKDAALKEHFSNLEEKIKKHQKTIKNIEKEDDADWHLKWKNEE